MRQPPPRSTLFPYTTLFRSQCERDRDLAAQRRNPERDRDRRLDLLLVVQPGAGAAPPKDRREQVSQPPERDRKSTRLNSSHRCISYAVFCLKKKKKKKTKTI